MYGVCNLRLSSNSLVRLTGDKIFYLRLTVEIICALVVFTKIYLRSYSCSGTNITAAVNCTSPKTEVQSKTIEIQTIEIQIYFLTKQISFLCR